MNFTREPIIETIITPREGFKLIIRSSKSSGLEEYLVDAVEVVSFGHSFFYRCLERPKSFLVPITDYEVVEVKETRMVLKTSVLEKSIKIGGGREGMRQQRHEAAQERAEEEQPAPETSGAPEKRLDKKRDRRRHRRRRGGGHEERGEQHPPRGEAESEHLQPAETGPASEEQHSSSSQADVEQAPAPISRLFPPPPTLISEKLGKWKEKFAAEAAEAERALRNGENGASQEESPPAHSESPLGESRDLYRMAAPVPGGESVQGEDGSWLRTIFTKNPFKNS